MIEYVLAAAAIIWLIRFLLNRNNAFANSDLKGPQGYPVIGNLLDIIRAPIPTHQLREWTQRFGKTYCYYEGARPIIVTHDVATLNDVFIKQFAKFHGRKQFTLNNNPDTDPRGNVFNTRGLRWKRQRTITAPTFSTGNLKMLMPLMNASSNLIAKRTAEHGEKPFDIYPYYQELTLEVICKVAFGQITDLQGVDHNPYLEDCRNLFAPKRTWWFNAAVALAVVFPETKDYVRAAFMKLTDIAGSKHPAIKLQDKLEEVVNARRANGPNADRTDFIDLFLEAETDADADDLKQLGVAKGNDSRSALTNSAEIDRRLTGVEVVMNCFLFLAAGYDTTSNTLAFATHLLATNQKIQDKLLQEIDAANLDENPSYDDIAKLPFLENVMKETLRFYPLGAFIENRECMEDTIVGNGQKVAKGTVVAADVWTLHFDKTIWGDDADEFCPDRFLSAESSGRPSVAWMPFGSGPRTCIGMRLATLEFKIVIAKLLKNHRFVTCDKTSIPLDIHGVTTTSPKDVFIKMQPR